MTPETKVFLSSMPVGTQLVRIRLSNVIRFERADDLADLADRKVSDLIEQLLALSSSPMSDEERVLEGGTGTPFIVQHVECEFEKGTLHD